MYAIVQEERLFIKRQKACSVRQFCSDWIYVIIDKTFFVYITERRNSTMDQKYKVGDVVTGKVTGIQPYGAFVALDDETQGLVHISEITYGYVKDVHEFIKVGDEIMVKILDVDEDQKKISLSIRVLQESPVSKKREVAPRKTLQERVNEADADGFRVLQQKLQSWIKQQGQ